MSVQLDPNKHLWVDREVDVFIEPGETDAVLVVRVPAERTALTRERYERSVSRTWAPACLDSRRQPGSRNSAQTKERRVPLVEREWVAVDGFRVRVAAVTRNGKLSAEIAVDGPPGVELEERVIECSESSNET